MKVVDQGQGELIRPPDPFGFREHNREKSKAFYDKRMTEEEAIERFVRDGQYIGFELYGTVRCPMSLVRALIRSGKKGFSVAGQGVHELDLLLAAGIVEKLDFTYIGEEVYGVSPIVRRACGANGSVKTIVEWSNAALSWRFKAAAMGVPFLPTFSMLGSDTLRYSAAKVVECPFTGLKLTLLPALVLDVGFIHVHRADKFGNCQIEGVSGFCAEMARASKVLIVSAEEIVDTEVIRQNPEKTIIPYYLVDAVVHAPFGSWPGEMASMYERDEEHLKYFLEMANTEEGTRAYLEEWVYGVKDHKALLEKVGHERLETLKVRARR
jgi:acyl CoA:acetate/3-ketoacid CoA transferase alpha subunit